MKKKRYLVTNPTKFSSLSRLPCFIQILRRCGGSVELVDVSNELPQLVRRSGLKKWKVRYFIFFFESFDMLFVSSFILNILILYFSFFFW